MERNINDVNREPYPSFRGAPFGDTNGLAEPFWQRVVGDGFLVI